MYRFLPILLILPMRLWAQVSPLHDHDVPQALITHSAVLSGQDFRDYMKGSGAVFLEYGLKDLLVQDLRWKEEHVVLEAYEMPDAVSAYGIFSVSLNGCIAKDSLTSFDCFSLSGYQCAYGRFYLRISSESPSAGDNEFFSFLARKFFFNNPDSLFKLPAVFMQDPFRKYPRHPFCTMGILGVQHTPIPWQDLFILVRNTMFAVILPLDWNVYFARISFTDASDRNTFLKRAGFIKGYSAFPNITTPDGLYREFRQIDETTIYFLECRQPFSISSLVP